MSLDIFCFLEKNQQGIINKLDELLKIRFQFPYFLRHCPTWDSVQFGSGLPYPFAIAWLTGWHQENNSFFQRLFFLQLPATVWKQKILLRPHIYSKNNKLKLTTYIRQTSNKTNAIMSVF